MGLSEDEGREEVRSMTWCIRGDNWFSTEEAVFERPNIRLASFVGVAEGDVDGEIELNIIEKSRSDGLGVDGGGAPCVFEDFGFVGVASSTSVSASSSTLFKLKPLCKVASVTKRVRVTRARKRSLQPYPRAQVCRRRHFGSFPGSHGLLLVNSHKIIPELRHPHRSFLSSHYHYITNSLKSFTPAFGSAVEAETTLPQPLRIPLVTRQVAYTQSKSSISLLASS